MNCIRDKSFLLNDVLSLGLMNRKLCPPGMLLRVTLLSRCWSPVYVGGTGYLVQGPMRCAEKGVGWVYFVSCRAFESSPSTVCFLKDSVTVSSV